jgi:ribosomal protein S27E
MKCNNCEKEDDFSVHGVSGYGVEIECNGCGNKEEIFW